MNDEKNELKIVVVDDSSFTRKTIIKILEEENFKVVGEADSAEKAIQIFNSSDANLYIVDIVMPEVSGLEVAKVITESFGDTYVIMISSLMTENLVVESISHGAIDFIQKPFEKEELIQSIQKVESLLLENKSY